KLEFCYVEGRYCFGQPLGQENEYYDLTKYPYQETINPCDSFNSPFTNRVNNKKFKMKFPDHEHMLKFFNLYKI
ncbi:10823_t:CDS:1, partial [Racocetra persica]